MHGDGHALMVKMKTISVTEFQAGCLELLDEVVRTTEPLMLTWDGKPTAMVIPLPGQCAKKWKLGQFRVNAEITGDIVNPSDVSWRALG